MAAFQARFQENSGPTAVAQGRIWMARGRMRVAYDPPSRQLLIASRGQAIHHDPILGSTSHLPAPSTPLGPLLQDPPRLADPSLLVQEIRRQPGILRVRDAQGPKVAKPPSASPRSAPSPSPTATSSPSSTPTPSDPTPTSRSRADPRRASNTPLTHASAQSRIQAPSLPFREKQTGL